MLRLQADRHMPVIYHKRYCPKRRFCLPIVQNTVELTPRELWVGLACSAVLNLTILLMGTTIFPRSHPQVSLEGFSERGHRLVACGCRDEAQLVITRAQPRGSYIEPDAREIAEWRLADQLREPGRESGSGEGYTVCELGNGPGLMRLIMQQDQRSSDLLVPQGGQPSGFGCINIFIQIGADDLHEQNVGQPCDNRRRATAA
jgi:hypothetical protein